ncbi:hypothetical protein FB451DRAFT_1177064 [Mycena latifolia]|nr:hypothetical protein FB451DRAFT_1177064 [Mycena latifolia]
MPPQLSVTEIRLKSLIDYLTIAVSTLQDFSDVSSTPFLKAISSTTASLLTSSIRRNKEECARLLDHVHTVLYAIIALHINSESGGVLPPETLDHVGKFMRTLQKIHVFVNAEHDGTTFKRLFRQSETTALLKECKQGLQQALDVFKVKIETDILNNLAAAQDNAEKIHNGLLQLIATLADDMSSDQTSSIIGTLSYSRNRWDRENQSGESGPPPPTNFRPIRSAIFVPCDSATSSIDLASVIASHLDLKAENNPTKSIIRYLQGIPPCLLVLDNFETPWEPSESRGGVEEFLSLLSDIPHLALITTLRGAERPAKVAWTRPFLPPLNTLTDAVARQIFIDIADDFHEESDVQKLLGLTGNLPLAVTLIAHLVAFEGCSLVLDRWETEKIRELAQKPHEPHAAFLPELRERPWEVNELHRHFICRVQAAKSVRKASGARVMQASCVGKTASHASASNPCDFR